MTQLTLKDQIEMKRNPEGYVLRKLVEMEAEFQARIDAMAVKAEDQQKKVDDTLGVVVEAAKKIDTNEIIKSVVALIPPPEDGVDADEAKVVEAVMSQIRQPDDGKTPVIDYNEIARKAADLVPKPVPLVPGIDFEIPEAQDEETGETIAEKLGVDLGFLRGLKNIIANITRTSKEKGGGNSAAVGGGGMGNPKHQSFTTSSATTTVTLNSRVAASGFALWVYYNGQFLVRGTHYTVGSDMKTLTFTFTLDDSTAVDVTYIRT